MNLRFLARWMLVLAVSWAPAAMAAEVQVMISAGFYGVYSQLVPAFERATGHKIVTTRGPSMGDSPEAIPTRLGRGEHADVVIMDGGGADGLIKSGTYLSTKLFPQMGIADQLAGKSRKVRGPPSGEPVAAVVARGESEIGFQQVAELIHVPGVTFVGPIPAEVQPGHSFAGAITSNSKNPQAAAELLKYLSAPEAAPVIVKAGLTPVPAR